MVDRRLVLFALPLALLSPAARAVSLADEIMGRLARLPSRSASFVEEKRLASLTAPLVSRGTLVFTKPSHLEKNTDTPKKERLVIDGGQLTIAVGTEQPRSVSLDDNRALRALADTLRAVLAGDLPTLRRIYTIEEQGTQELWRFLLVPQDAALRRALARVTLDGGGTDLRQISIQQANGDEQRLTIQSLR